MTPQLGIERVDVVLLCDVHQLLLLTLHGLAALSRSREAVDLTAAGGGLGALAEQLAEGTRFEGYQDAQLKLEGCSVVGLLVNGEPVCEVTGEGALDRQKRM